MFRVGEKNDQVHIIQSGSVWLSLNQNLFGAPATSTNAKHTSSFLPPMVQTPPSPGGKRPAKRSLSVMMRGVDAQLKRDGAEKFATAIEAAMSIDDTLMTDAGRRLRLRDVAMRRSARLIQRAWRQRRAERNKLKAGDQRPSTGKPRGKFGVNWMRSHLVHAPAYFGEACLWVPLDQWDTIAPAYKYAARCESLVEQIVIPRSSLQIVVDHFSPWLGDRFEFFREAVSESMQEFSYLAEDAALSRNSHSVEEFHREGQAEGVKNKKANRQPKHPDLVDHPDGAGNGAWAEPRSEPPTLPGHLDDSRDNSA